MGGMESILVVDDIEEQRKIASTILQRLNYKVRSVVGGEEAVEFIQKQPVDLILLDMIMEPGINGLETCKRIFAFNPDAVIVIASGYADAEMVSQALELGARHYIKKPYSIGTLGAAVRDNLARNV
jgi:two-component system cell cycle sensor histidine kinase/response regulator CckA